MNEENTSQEKKVIEIASQLSAIEMQGTDNEPLLCERPAEFKPFRAAHQGKLM